MPRPYLHWLADGEYQRQLTAAELAMLMPYLAREIGMTPVGETLILFQDPPHPWGLSAVQPVAESHLMLHYMAPMNIAVDVFACKKFEPEIVRRILLEHFQVKRIYWEQLVERGPETEAV